MLAIAGGKGGSGKTTTTLGVARAIDGPSVAVDADCDLPNLHALAGVPRGAPPDGLGHPDPGADDDTRIVPAPRDAPDGIGSRLRRLRARERGEADASPVTVGAIGRWAATGHTATGNRGEESGHDTPQDFDASPDCAAPRDRETIGTVLVDCPAGAGPDATVPLRVADGVLVVATPCVAALRDAAKTAAMARAVGTPVVGGVLTRARLVPPGVEELLGCEVLATVPDARDPLADERVRRAYDDLGAALFDRPKG
ncbi:CDP-4-keto-6-deoxy-D-glucose-3-dehydrase [Halobellus salinisoli]|uniref:nucleotide-binding protein n=1 Tax=Halobellus salinisoli TaxID=3108500 RepID=UPI00300872BA